MISGHTMARLFPLVWRMIAAMALAVGCGLLLIDSPAPATAPPARRPVVEAAAPGPITVGRAPDYRAIAEQPLFDPTRRPWAAPVSRPQDPARQPPTQFADYRLTAVVISGDVRRAVLRRSNGEKPVTLSVGEALQGWVLREIDLDRVRFGAGDENRELGFSARRKSGQ